jgi:hypothetical protein
MSVPRKRRFSSCLTFSNVVSLLALFVALGGSAYAAGVLPMNSVGRAQLQANSVTSSKLAPSSVGRSELKSASVTADDLAPGSVELSALAPALRARIAHRAAAPPPGAQGLAGATGAAGVQGPVGPQGPRGPGAVRVAYSAQATISPQTQTAVDVGGFHLNAQCEDTDPGTQLNLSATTDAAASVMENINVDGGSGLASFAPAESANLQINLPAGTTILGGPSVAQGNYSRIFARLIYVASETTVELTVVLSLDGTAGTCSIQGVGVPATD